MTEKWTDKWMEVHRRETEQQIAELAIRRQLHKDEWWEEFNKQQEWVRQQDESNP